MFLKVNTTFLHHYMLVLLMYAVLADFGTQSTYEIVRSVRRQASHLIWGIINASRITITGIINASRLYSFPAPTQLIFIGSIESSQRRLFKTASHVQNELLRSTR